MCPACISATTVALVGATSAGGLVAFLVTLFAGRKGPKRARRERDSYPDTAAHVAAGR